MSQKIKVEEIKKYNRAVQAGWQICYKCGAINPDCGMVPLVSVNLDDEAITDTICNDCYNKFWKEAEEKSDSDKKAEDVWNLGKE